jgi:hypothetical protein
MAGGALSRTSLSANNRHPPHELNSVRVSSIGLKDMNLDRLGRHYKYDVTEEWRSKPEFQTSPFKDHVKRNHLYHDDKEASN